MTPNIPPDIPQDLQEKIAKLPPGLAKQLLKIWQMRRERAVNNVPDAENPPSKTDDKAPSKEAPASTPSEHEEGAQEGFHWGVFGQVQAKDEWEQARSEWEGLLNRAEKLLRRWGHWERLGPLARMVRLLIAQALRFGAHKDPSREANIHLAQWELAAMLGVSERTVERWLYDPRYEHHRQVARMWLAWEVWFTDGEGIGVEGPVKGGTVWRVRVRPVFRGRPLRVLAPYLRWPWRDLGEDKREGRTARIVSSSMSGYKEGLLLGRGVTLQGVVGAPLSTLIQKPPLHLDPDIAKNLRDLLRVASIPRGREGRREWAQQVASQIVAALQDYHSKAFWLRVVWGALRAVVFGGGEGPLRLLFRVVQIAKEAMEDGFARSPGAYAQGLLKREGFWDLVRPYESCRVGAV